jgi:CBS domain-containing protein
MLCLLGLIPNNLGSAQGQDQDTEIRADIDGNGIPDRIVEVSYQKAVLTYRVEGKLRCEPQTTMGHFVRYILYRDSRKPGKVIFDHQVGSGDESYWWVKLKLADDLNQDGLRDLIFSAKDDTTEEIVFLLQKPRSFKAVYMGAFGVIDEGLNDQKEIVQREIGGKGRQWLLGRWNPAREVFEGLRIGWITPNCVRIRAEPHSKAKVVGVALKGDIVRIVEDGQEIAGDDEVEGEASCECPPAIQSSPKVTPPPGWRQVRLNDTEGWVSTRYLSLTSPTKEFK